MRDRLHYFANYEYEREPLTATFQARYPRFNIDLVGTSRADIAGLRIIPAGEARFDLVIATNVLIYYSVFEQSLAVANIAQMLRPWGIFLSNNLVAELPRSPLTLVGFTDVVYTSTRLGDRVLWYRRQ
jgi:hypothetical protein